MLCNNNTYKETGYTARDSKEFSVVRCDQCGLLQLSLIPSVEDDKLFYDQNSQARFFCDDVHMDDVIEKAMPDVARRMKLLSKLYGDNPGEVSILEIGSGYGLLLKHASDAGFKVEGIEISNSRRDLSSKIAQVPVYDFNIINTRLDKYIDKKYDAIMLFQVLEHIQSPAQFIKNAKTALKPTGRLIVEVPNVNDHLLTFCSEYNSFYWQRAHLSYYNPTTLKSIIKMGGFTKVDIRGVQRYSIENAMNWLLTGKPQINKPSYTARTELQWVDSYYRKQLEVSLTCDTLIAIAENNIL